MQGTPRGCVSPVPLILPLASSHRASAPHSCHHIGHGGRGLQLHLCGHAGLPLFCAVLLLPAQEGGTRRALAPNVAYRGWDFPIPADPTALKTECFGNRCGMEVDGCRVVNPMHMGAWGWGVVLHCGIAGSALSDSGLAASWVAITCWGECGAQAVLPVEGQSSVPTGMFNFRKTLGKMPGTCSCVAG